MKERPAPHQSLMDFMKEYADEQGKYGQPATYEVLKERFGVSAATLVNWFRGYPPSREMARKAADNAAIPRIHFLLACGYYPGPEDMEEDERHYPDTIGPYKRALAALEELRQSKLNPDAEKEPADD